MKTPLQFLIVEDNAHARELLCEMLAMLGYAIQAAGSAEEAIAILEKQRFDVLLSDINLPGMSGIELAKIVLAKAPGMQIIFASGYGYLVADKTDFEFVLLPKPFGLEQLSHAIGQILVSQIHA